MATIFEKSCAYARKGQEFTRQWLDKNCKLISVDRDMANAMADYGAFQTQVAASAGVGRAFLG